MKANTVRQAQPPSNHLPLKSSQNSLASALAGGLDKIPDKAKKLLGVYPATSAREPTTCSVNVNGQRKKFQENQIMRQQKLAQKQQTLALGKVQKKRGRSPLKAGLARAFGFATKARKKRKFKPSSDGLYSHSRPANDMTAQEIRESKSIPEKAKRLLGAIELGPAEMMVDPGIPEKARRLLGLESISARAVRSSNSIPLHTKELLLGSGTPSSSDDDALNEILFDVTTLFPTAVPSQPSAGRKRKGDANADEDDFATMLDELAMGSDDEESLVLGIGLNEETAAVQTESRPRSPNTTPAELAQARAAAAAQARELHAQKIQMQHLQMQRMQMQMQGHRLATDPVGAAMARYG
jgi:hypothetical protein